MGWAVRYEPSTRVVETIYTGDVTSDELSAAFEETVAVAVRHSTTLVLSDCSTMRGGHSIVELYALAKELEAHPISARLREAIVLPALEAPSRDVEFWVAACRNRGIDARVFPTRDRALEWLLGC